MSNLRLVAAGVVKKVLTGSSLADLFPATLVSLADDRERAFVQVLCYGVCRFYSRLDATLQGLLKTPLKNKDLDIYTLLLVGLYQLMEMRVPPYAAVGETVAAVDGLGKTWAKGLVNGVLRSYMRDRESPQDKIKSDVSAYYAHPLWWIEKINHAWPDYWEDILFANNEHPPFVLRVNKAQMHRDHYRDKLKALGFECDIIPETTSGLVLESAIPVDELPGFSSGDVSVQDGAAQLAASLLCLAPQQRVLDACAAPGGKLMHILELEPQLAALIAIEKDLARLHSVQENLARIRMTEQCHCLCQPAHEVEAWWDGQHFDRILLDAPCSGSGVIRRHPDIKLLRRPTDIKLLAYEQLQLLQKLWPLLKEDGLLLYVTCSIFPEENVHVLRDFLQSYPDAQEDKILAEWGVACEIGRQILPGMHNMDGFYYARLRKSKG